LFSHIFSSADVSIDLGTANTRLAGARLFAALPTKTRVKRRSSEMVTPVRGGVVKDVPATTFFLRNLLKRAHRFRRPRVLICAPSDVSATEKEALFEATRRAGASHVAIVPEPLAAAVGAGLDLSSPYAQMLVDIGDGVTDIAVIRGGDIIQTSALRKAGSDLHRAVQRMMLDRHPVIISRTVAETLTCRLGSVDGHSSSKFLKIYGVEASGQQITVTVRSEDVYEAIAPVVQMIVETIVRAVRYMSPQVCAEVAETGICLTGGVAGLPGIDKLIEKETNLPVKLAPAPLTSVIDGASRMLETSAKTNFWQFAEKVVPGLL
jgi:rod shape-determining protein MreB